MRSSGKRARSEPISPDRPTRFFRPLPSLHPSTRNIERPPISLPPRRARRSALRGLPLLLRLHAQALLLPPELGSELGAEVLRLEHLANLDFRLHAGGIGAALDPL